MFLQGIYIKTVAFIRNMVFKRYVNVRPGRIIALSSINMPVFFISNILP